MKTKNNLKEIESEFVNYYERVELISSEFMEEYFDWYVSEMKKGNSFSVIEQVDVFTDDIFLRTRFLDHALIIDQSENVESDRGLWEGLDAFRTIESIAFFTLRNDVTDYVRESLEAGFTEELEKAQNKADELQLKLDKLEVLGNDEEAIEETDTKLEEALGYVGAIEIVLEEL